MQQYGAMRFLLVGYCLDFGLYGSDIGLEFQTRLWYYSDINGDCNDYNGVLCDII